MDRALSVGRLRNIDYVRRNKRVPMWLEAQYALYDKLVFSKLKQAVGIENGNIFPTAGAPLSDTINEFLHSCGSHILYGYGLSETCLLYTSYTIRRDDEAAAHREHVLSFRCKYISGYRVS